MRPWITQSWVLKLAEGEGAENFSARERLLSCTISTRQKAQTAAVPWLRGDLDMFLQAHVEIRSPQDMKADALGLIRPDLHVRRSGEGSLELHRAA